MHSRSMMIAMGGAVAAVGAEAAVAAVGSAQPSPTTLATRKARTVQATDGIYLFHLDWGTGAPVLFTSNWGMDSEMWQYQMTPMSREGHRVVAYDRRGIGRSDRPSGGFDIDTLADDMAAVIEQLDLSNLTIVGHSMGCCEIVRYLSRHGSNRVARIVLVAPATPFLLKTKDNPDGFSLGDNDQMRAAWCEDFPKWVTASTPAYFSHDASPEMKSWVAGMALRCPLRTAVELSYVWSQVDLRAELPQIKVPTLIVQGDKDSLPLDLTGRRTAAMIPGARLNVYEGESHGLMFTSVRRLNADLQAFTQS
jgi:non-heme chloroperoxidase